MDLDRPSRRMCFILLRAGLMYSFACLSDTTPTCCSQEHQTGARRRALDFWVTLGFTDSLVCKESVCDAGDPGSIPGSGRSPGEGKAYPLQYSGLENSMSCIVHGVAKNWTQLSDFHFN